MRPNNAPNRFLTALLLAFALTGCASVPETADSNPRDPYEHFNRTVFRFNERTDKYVLRPVAQTYTDVTPDFVRTGIRNFFSNLGDVGVVIQDLLQGKPGQGAADSARLVMNTTVGLFGLLDVASVAGLEKHSEDFGQTLAVWGWKDSSYLVLPLLGPSTVRDGVGKVAALPWGGTGWGKAPAILSDNPAVADLNTSSWTIYEIYAAQLVDTRASLLGATNVLQEAALDKYSFTRDAYLQRRRNLIYDGHPPEEDE
jgi:phospholipid-binding lipoprotein MlaA